jgi:hypothetical protein
MADSPASSGLETQKGAGDNTESDRISWKCASICPVCFCDMGVTQVDRGVSGLSCGLFLFLRDSS